MPPVITLRDGIKFILQIPSADADNDDVRCRWSTGTECETTAREILILTLTSSKT